jgi:hypothetical protein
VGKVKVTNIEKGDSIDVSTVNPTINQWLSESDNQSIGNINVRTEGLARRNFEARSLTEPHPTYAKLDVYQSDVQHNSELSKQLVPVRQPWIYVGIPLVPDEFPTRKNTKVLIHCSFAFRTNTNHGSNPLSPVKIGRIARFQLGMADNQSAQGITLLNGTERIVTTGVERSHVTQSVGMTHLLTDLQWKHGEHPLPNGNLYIFLCACETAHGSQLNISSVNLFFRKYQR